MTTEKTPQADPPYDVEQDNGKRAKRSKLLILGAGAAVGIGIISAAGVILASELTEHEERHHESGNSIEDSQPVDVDPQGKFTPGYAEGEESEHVGHNDEHPESFDQHDND